MTSKALAGELRHKVNEWRALALKRGATGREAFWVFEECAAQLETIIHRYKLPGGEMKKKAQ